MLVPFHEDAFDIYILHYLSSFVVLLHPARKKWATEGLTAASSSVSLLSAVGNQYTTT